MAIPVAGAVASPVAEPDAPELRAPMASSRREVRGPDVRLSVGETVVLRAPHTRSFSSQPANGPCTVRPGPDDDSFLVYGRHAGEESLLFVFADDTSAVYRFAVAP